MNRQLNQITALYCRIDGGKSPSAPNAILNQQKVLVQYAKAHGLENIHIFSDCGFSGTNFNRPQFQHMLQEIKAGNVSTLVVKDMGRLFRSYYNTAILLETVLPQYGVTFYSLDDLDLPVLPLYQAIYAKGGRV